MRMTIVPIVLLCAMSSSPCLPAEDWARFRGPNGSGVSNATGLPAAFGPAKNINWRTEVPFGRSSPILAADRVIVTGSVTGKPPSIADVDEAKANCRLPVMLGSGEWSEWLGGLSVAPGPDGTTELSGPVPDQAALHGLLRHPVAQGAHQPGAQPGPIGEEGGVENNENGIEDQRVLQPYDWVPPDADSCANDE